VDLQGFSVRPDGASQAVKRFSYNGPHFRTKEEAEDEGVLLVKRWIENGMSDTR
jgi:hypothetical protein